MGCLPDYIQKDKHNDWIWPLSLIPRRWTSYCLPMPPGKVCGNSQYIEIFIQPGYPIAPGTKRGSTYFKILSMPPVGEIGTWSIQNVYIQGLKIRIPCYFTFTLRAFNRRIYFNIGCKPDVTYEPSQGVNNWHWAFPEMSLTFNKI